MKLVVCVVASVLLSLASWLYLNLRKSDESRGAQPLKVKLLTDKKLLIYSACAMAVLIGVATELYLVYPMQTLLTDLKTLTVLAVLVTVCVTDIKSRTIPNEVILAGVILRVIYAVAEFFTLGTKYFSILKSDGIAVLVSAVLFLLCALAVKNGIGMGDVKLVMMMGLFQGFTSLISALFVSMVVAFFMAIVLLILKKKGRKDSLEFAPALLAGTLISVVLTGC